MPTRIRFIAFLILGAIACSSDDGGPSSGTDSTGDPTGTNGTAATNTTSGTAATSGGTDATSTATTSTSVTTTGPDTGGDATGEVTSTIVTIPFGMSSTCEHDGSERILSERIRAVTPERMYSAGCNDPSGVRRLFVSVPVNGGHTRTHPQLAEDHHSQVIFEAELDPATSTFSLTGNEVHQPDCLDAHGIAVASDCSTVATLCRRPHFTSQTEPFTADLVVNAAQKGDIDAPGPIGGEPTDNHVDYNDEMWLYEWKGVGLSEEPDKYVVHKGIGPLTRARGLGNYYLLNGENDNSYAYAVRSSTGGGSRHVADAFLVVDRSGSEYVIAADRGYGWACGRGHTLFNRPVYNPFTQQYAIWCATDFTEDRVGGLSGQFFRTEAQGDGERNEFITLDFDGNHRQGGVQVLQPLSDGNYIGAFVGHPEHTDNWHLGRPTMIGLVKFDGTSGATLGEINWLVSNSDAYLGHAQLGTLGNEEFLLGYAELHRSADGDEEGRNGVDFMVPWSYHVVEIDTDGNALTEATELGDVGWGDQDQWTNLNTGELAWAYTPEPVLASATRAPPCSGETLQLSTYRTPE